MLSNLLKVPQLLYGALGHAPNSYSKAFQLTFKCDHVCLSTFDSHSNSVIAYRLRWSHLMGKKTEAQFK